MASTWIDRARYPVTKLRLKPPSEVRCFIRTDIGFRRCPAIFMMLVVLTIARPAVAQEVSAPETPCTVDTPTLLTVADVPDLFEPAIMELLRWSPTFRQQCLRLVAEASRLRLEMRVTWPVLPFPARTTIGRAPTGRLQAWIDLAPASRHDSELIAHEIEHVIEYLDGVDVRELASRRKGAHLSGWPNLFESERAIRVGREVAREMSANRRASANLLGARAAQ